MINIKKITLFGETDKGNFKSEISFIQGINIISAPNGFGKSLATSSILWALGVEHVMVLTHDSPTFLPESITVKFKLEDGTWANITKSSVTLSIINQEGKKLNITRSIVGGNNTIIHCKLEDNQQDFCLTSNKENNFNDPLTNLTRFLMKWAGLDPVRVVTRSGKSSWLYLENLASLFYINQLSGWADLYASQVRNYGILEVDEAVFEYVLGLKAHLEKRVSNLKEGVEKKDKRKLLIDAIVEVNQFISKYNSDYRIKFLSKSIEELENELKDFQLIKYLKDVGDCDLAKEAEREKLELSNMLAKINEEEEKAGQFKRSDFSEIMDQLFQLKVQLQKTQDDRQNITLNIANKQNTIFLLDKKIKSTDHLTEFKKSHIGFFEHDLVCPTCVQNIDTDNYDWNDLSIEDLQRSLDTYSNERKILNQSIAEDRKVVIKLDEKIKELYYQISSIQSNIDQYTKSVTRNEEVLLSMVDKISTQKVNIRKIGDDIIKATDLSTALRDIVNTTNLEKESEESDLEMKNEVKTIGKFVKSYRNMLKEIELTVFQEVKEESEYVNLDDTYLPLYRNQYLKNLASASDQCRIILPYVLSSLKTSIENNGNHLGFVVFDEPIQQNPDVGLRDRMISFFKNLPNELNGQVIIFTSLTDEECSTLSHLEGFQHFKDKRFLKL